MDLSKLEQLSDETLIAIHFKTRDILQDRKVDLSTVAKRSFSRGDIVKFQSEKQGREVHIRITSIGPKNIAGEEVFHAGGKSVVGTKWRCSPDVLTPVSSERNLPAVKPRPPVKPSEPKSALPSGGGEGW